MKVLLIAALWAAPAAAGHGPDEMSRARAAGVRFLGCELLASGRILAEVSSRLDLVRGEAAHLGWETPALDAAWRSRRGEGGAEVPLADLEVGRAVESLRGLGALQTSGDRALARAEKRYRAFRRDLARDTGRGGDGQRLGPVADAVYGDLAAAVESLNRAAAGLREGQDLLDAALARAGWALAQAGAAQPLTEWRPWHENYRSSGMARPDYRLELGEEWEAQTGTAHHELHTDWKPAQGVEREPAVR